MDAVRYPVETPMKGIVTYDSVHGNTRQVAEAIAEQIRAEGHQVDVFNLKEGVPKALTGDFMFIGSPTRAGRMTGSVKEFMENIDVGYWKNKPIVLFDTLGPFSKDAEKRKKWLEIAYEGDKNAAGVMRKACQGRGLSNCARTLHIAVVGFMGPLAPDALDMAKAYTREFLGSLK
jgi:flavodoxin